MHINVSLLWNCHGNSGVIHTVGAYYKVSSTKHVKDCASNLSFPINIISINFDDVAYKSRFISKYM